MGQSPTHPDGVPEAVFDGLTVYLMLAIGLELLTGCYVVTAYNDRNELPAKRVNHYLFDGDVSVAFLKG